MRAASIQTSDLKVVSGAAGCQMEVPRPQLAIRTTAQIGRCGELLVQYRLLKHGIDSAPMTTDAGIDLVAYAPISHKAMTIQVKANLRPKPGGGRGQMALGWRVDENCPANLVAFVDLALDQVWLLSQAELAEHAQQQSNGRRQFYFYTGTDARPRKTNRLSADFEHFKLERRVGDFFTAMPGPR